MKFTPNRRKILEAVLLLIQEGEKARRPLTQYQIVKAIFLADTAHLNTYGRPITFDNYSALLFGPVPEEAYNMLKPDYVWTKHFEMPIAPWRLLPVSEKANQYIDPDREPDLRVLSKSDVRALCEGLKEVWELGFGGVRDQTHKHPAYVHAWERRGNAKAKAMDYALLFDSPDPAAVEELAYASAHA